MTRPPAAPPVIFTGSSIIALWDSLPRWFPEWHIVNTAVGGYQTHNVLEHAVDMLLKPVPRAVCYYCGSNDICSAVPVNTIIQNIMAAYEHVHTHVPACPFAYLSVIRAPQKRNSMDEVAAVNTRMAALAASTPGLHYIDINPAFTTPAGAPRRELYLEDELHLTAEGYDAFGAYLAPRLRALLD